MNSMLNLIRQLLQAMGKSLTLFAVLALLTSCDGGLFGTGDGTDNLDIDASDSGIASGNDSDANSESEEAQEPDSVSGSQPEQTSSLVFDNVLVGSDRIEPTISLFNNSTRSLDVVSEASATPVFSSSIAPGTSSEPGTLFTGANLLNIVDTQTGQPVFSIQPLNAGASSVTTLIARNLIDQQVDVVALRTLSVSNTPTVAQVRLVQATLLNELDSATTFTLQPNGSLPGNTEVEFLNVAASTANEAQYRTVGAGTYQLTDALNRFEPIALTVLAGEIYTLVIINTQPPVLSIQVDSDLLEEQ